MALLAIYRIDAKDIKYIILSKLIYCIIYCIKDNVAGRTLDNG